MKIAVLAALSAILSACSVPPPMAVGLDPADPDVPVAPTRYRSVTAGTVDYRPIDPKPWAEQNQQVAPQPKSGAGGPR
ncbi:hypothetical protein [Rhodoplanes serenus]|jgi:hypothetical protein|uniref:hypothetical protein n=1 Tax=Rhodoplanes serenus TaxID=200615 RepID=UPI000DAD3351|nr:hypothetical protein [Rhodoplanes serenus]RAI34337.1 hypothetical protein CH340_09405 [Rhodoplanes serenus]